MDASSTPKPHVLSDDGKIVTVMTAQGDTVPLDRSNPDQAQMIQAFEAHGMAGEDSPAAHVAGVQSDAAALDNGTPLMPDQAAAGDMGQQLQAQADLGAAAPSTGSSDDAMFNTMPAGGTAGAPATPPAAPVAAPVDQTGRPAPVAPAAPPVATPSVPAQMPAVKSKTAQDTEYKGISGKDRANLEKSKAGAKAAVVAEFAAKPTMQDAAATTAYGEQVNAIEMRQRQREADQRQYADQMRTRLDEQAQELSKMKVNPDFFGRMDTGNKMMAGLSIMLGGIGQGLSHTDKNPGLEVIERAIDRDVDAQKTNITNAKGAFEAQKGGYEAFLRATGDERLATIAETQRQLDVLKSTLMKNAAGNANQVAAAAQKTALAAIDEKYATLEAEKSQVIDKKSSSGEVDIGGPKQAQAAPPEEAKAIAEKERIIAELRSIQKAAQEAEGKNQIGPQARLAAIARAIGADTGEDAAAINARLKQYTAQRLHDLTGRVTPAETQIMEPSFPSVHDNPKVFNRLLNQELENAERELLQRKAQWAGHTGLPNSTIVPSVNVDQQKSTVGFKKQ